MKKEEPIGNQEAKNQWPNFGDFKKKYEFAFRKKITNSQGDWMEIFGYDETNGKVTVNKGKAGARETMDVIGIDDLDELISQYNNRGDVIDNDEKFLSWEDFQKKYPEHADFFNKKRTYKGKSGEDINFVSYDEKTGQVFVQKIGQPREAVAMDDFEEILKSNLLDTQSNKDTGKKNKKGDYLKFSVEEERDPARAGTLHTLHKLKESDDTTLADLVPEDKIKVTKDTQGDITRMDVDYELGDPKRKKEMDEAINKKLAELSRKLWDTLVTHGYAEEQEDGSYKMTKNVSDLDGESCLVLCKLAGLDTSRVKYVPQGTGEDEEGLVMDTYSEEGESGTVAKDGGRIVVEDHHGKGSGRDTSATKNVYELLTENDLLPKEKYYEDFINFVTDEDNKTYETSTLKENFFKSWKTLRGLHYYIAPEDIIKLFRDARESGKIFDPDAALPEDFLKTYRFNAKTDSEYDKRSNGRSLEDLGKIVKERIDRSLRHIREMEKEGFVFDTGDKNYGKILIDTGVFDEKTGTRKRGKFLKKVPMGYDAARATGYDNLLIWSPDLSGFVLYTTKPLRDRLYPENEIRFQQGFNVRGNMWMKPRNKEIIQVTLEEIFAKLSKKKVKVPDKLLEALKKEGLENRNVKAPEGVDVLAMPDKDDLGKKETTVEKKISPERQKQIDDIIGSYSKHGKSYMKLYAKKGPFEIKGKDKKDTETKLVAKVEGFIWDGVGNFNGTSVGIKKLSNEEIDNIVKKTMENIFSNKR